MRVAWIAAVVGAAASLSLARGEEKDLAQQIFDTMVQVHGVAAGHRPVHAKGLVCAGTFTATKAGAGLSKAAHFQGTPVGVTVRFSDGSPEPLIPDNAANAGPRGMAIRFNLAGGDVTDIVAMSHNGFVVANGEEFLALQKSVVATDPSKPHPWPVEAFLGSHPRALKFVQDNATAPASFATQSFFSNDSFVFVSKEGTRQTGRYKILPAEGETFLTAEEAKEKGADYLVDDLKARLAKGPVKYRLVVQLANAGDVTSDPSLVWPEDRKTVEVGEIAIASVATGGELGGSAEKVLAFDPINLTEGIEQSDDELPALRSQVYALSAAYRGRK